MSAMSELHQQQQEQEDDFSSDEMQWWHDVGRYEQLSNGNPAPVSPVYQGEDDGIHSK